MTAIVANKLSLHESTETILFEICLKKIKAYYRKLRLLNEPCQWFTSILFTLPSRINISNYLNWEG